MKTYSESRRRNRLAVVCHFIWTTEDRQPFITPDLEPDIYLTIKAEVLAARCELLALNGVADHVHLIVSIPSTLAIAKLMNQVKGVSSSVARAKLGPQRYFAWASNYAAFSLSPEHCRAAISYVERQKEHHAQDTLELEWEAF